MPRTIRFHLDESCRQSIAMGLRLRGVDVTTTPEQDLIGASDEEQLAFARRHKRVTLTHDADFIALARTSPDHCGIVYCHQRRRSIGEIIRGLILLWETYDAGDLDGRVEYL